MLDNRLVNASALFHGLLDFLFLPSAREDGPLALFRKELVT